MEFKKSKYYDKNFLGKYLYENIQDMDKILTIQEFFNINITKKQYHIKNQDINYKLTIKDNYYEFNCQKYDDFLFLVFDKPVHITGEHCRLIIAPEIIVENDKNESLSYCIANKAVINSSRYKYYYMQYSKTNEVYFYNKKISFWESEVRNFFIFNQELMFDITSLFLSYHKIKCFGACKDLKNTIQENKNFKEGIIHIG